MKTAIAKLKSSGPYSQSKHYSKEEFPMLDKEGNAAYEKRTWRERLHSNEAGNIFIPPMSFKKCLDDAAAFLGLKIPGKRNATWTKHFLAGVLVTEPLVLPIKKDAVKSECLFVPPDGKPGGGSRVEKIFPLIPSWEGEVAFMIFDETITEDSFKHHLTEAGKFIGIGRFRPRKGGFYGRFEVLSVKWK